MLLYKMPKGKIFLLGSQSYDLLNVFVILQLLNESKLYDKPCMIKRTSRLASNAE